VKKPPHDGTPFARSRKNECEKPPPTSSQYFLMTQCNAALAVVANYFTTSAVSSFMVKLLMFVNQDIYGIIVGRLHQIRQAGRLILRSMRNAMPQIYYSFFDSSCTLNTVLSHLREVQGANLSIMLTYDSLDTQARHLEPDLEGLAARINRFLKRYHADSSDSDSDRDEDETESELVSAIYHPPQLNSCSEVIVPAIELRRFLEAGFNIWNPLVRTRAAAARAAAARDDSDDEVYLLLQCADNPEYRNLLLQCADNPEYRNTNSNSSLYFQIRQK
jgi:hypothetical protein